MNFEDVNHWAKNYIEYATNQGYFVGTSETKFSPNEPMTRGMFVTVFARHENADLSKYNILPFSDIANEEYFTRPIVWAYENNLTKGTGNNCFSPNLKITREQAAYMLYKMISVQKMCENQMYFETSIPDIYKASTWAKVAIIFMNDNDYMIGDENGNFNPKSYLTRAECAVIFSRLDNQLFENFKPIIEEPIIYESGKASAYSESLIGGPTASGERLLSASYTVAVPISQYNAYKGRYVEIVYNNIAIIARCNDCGGFEKYGRVLDLSPGIIKAFGFSNSNSWGVRAVKYRWLD